MEHVRAFTTSLSNLEALQSHLANVKEEEHPFETSELYSSAVDAKIVNEELRRSRFRIFEDAKIFQLVENTLKDINATDPAFHYQLRHDNITETRYAKDGHFLKHRDFLSVESNLLEEFTLILCVTPQQLVVDGQGGETMIYPYASTTRPTPPLHASAGTRPTTTTAPPSHHRLNPQQSSLSLTWHRPRYTHNAQPLHQGGRRDQ